MAISIRPVNDNIQPIDFIVFAQEGQRVDSVNNDKVVPQQLHNAAAQEENMTVMRPADKLNVKIALMRCHFA